jgi:hypothetical protein
MSPADQSAHKNRLLGAMSEEDTDQFFSDLHPVSMPLREIIYGAGSTPRINEFG